MAEAVTKELHKRGLLAAAWDVGPDLAAKALADGHIQRALVRRRGRRRTWVQRDDARMPSTSATTSVRDDDVGELSSGECARQGEAGQLEEAEMAVEVLKALAGNSGVRVRESAAPFCQLGGEERHFLSVLIPAASRPPKMPR